MLMLVMIFAPSTPAWSVYVLSVGGAYTSTLVHIVIICTVHIVQWLEGKTPPARYTCDSCNSQSSL